MARRSSKKQPQTQVPEHVHGRACYDDAGPGAGGVSLICDKVILAAETIATTVPADDYASETDMPLGPSFYAEPLSIPDDFSDDPTISGVSLILYTTAPVDLDGAQTQDTGAAIGTLQHDDGTQYPYRKVLVPSLVAQDQAAAYGSGGWNTHTPGELAELLDQPRFQARFTPVGCNAARTEDDTTDAERTAAALHRVEAEEGDGALVRDEASLNDHDPDWIDAPQRLLVAPCCGCGEGRMTGVQRLCGVCVTAVETGTADAVLQVLALASRGRGAVARALARGQLRWGGKEKQVSQRLPEGTLATIQAVLQGVTPTKVKRYAVQINGVLYPVKQVVSVWQGKPYSTFDTARAIELLKQVPLDILTV